MTTTMTMMMMTEIIQTHTFVALYVPGFAPGRSSSSVEIIPGFQKLD